MNTELTMLFASAMLALLQFLPYLFAYLKHWGITIATSNRENTPPLPAWADRSIAAHKNMTENLVHFTALILITQIAGLSNEVTALGATLFFYARLLFVVVYTLGIPWIRTLVFMAGITGELLIAWQILKAL